MPEKYEKDMNVLMTAAAEVKVSSKKLKRYTFVQSLIQISFTYMYYLFYLMCCACME